MDLTYASDSPRMMNMTTPLDGRAFTFGMPSQAISVVCVVENEIESKGSFWNLEHDITVTGVFMLQLAIASFLTSICKFLLKPLGQASVVGQILGGIVAGPSVLSRNQSFRKLIFPFKSFYVLETISSFGVMFFLFLVGVRMDMSMIRKSGKKEWIIGLSTFVIPMLVAVPTTSYIKSFVEMDHTLETSISFSALLYATSSFHGVACFLEDLNLLNSELGRLAMSSCMISGFLSYTTLLVAFNIKQSVLKNYGNPSTTFTITAISAFGQMFFIQYAIRPLMIWMIKQTPEGERVKEIYHVSVLLIVLGCSITSEFLGQHGFFGPMFLGMVLPDGSVLAATLMDKFDFSVSFLMMPIYFFCSGAKTNLTQVNLKSYLVIQYAVVIGLFSKFLGTFLPSIFLFNMGFKEAVSLGLILSTVGVLDMQFFSRAYLLGYIDNRCFSMLNVMGMIITGIISLLVTALYDPSVRYITEQRRTIQHSLSDVELRLLVCVFNQDHVPNIINLLEASNPTLKNPIAIYLLHLVELVGRQFPLLVAHNSFTKEDFIRGKPSDSIVNAFKIYQQRNASVVTLQPFTTMAPLATMHEDICTLALDKKASMVILPFHITWNTDTIQVESTKFRNVNLNVLENAPCSVGILIDRGSSKGSLRSVVENHSSHRVGVFFIGGPDDREALAYAMNMMTHPKVTLTLVRFSDINENPNDDFEYRLDGDILNEFKLHAIESEKVIYKEEIVTDNVGTCNVIKSMEDLFDLILVGRRHEADSPILAGLLEWDEFPELGFGDMLVSNDFQGKVSVLVVQQHDVDSSKFASKEKTIFRHQTSESLVLSSKNSRRPLLSSRVVPYRSDMSYINAS